MCAIAALGQISYADQSDGVVRADKLTPFNKECLLTTEEYGAADRTEGVTMQSNLDNLVDELQDKVLFMRLDSIKVCHSAHYIHGIRIALIHDYTKDPEHNQALDTFYSKTAAPNRDLKFYEHMIGTQTGDCKNINLKENVRIMAILVKYEKGVVRSLEFKKSDGTFVKVGEEDEPRKSYFEDIINFTRNEDIVGVFGRTEPNTSQSVVHTTPVGERFVSLGFILNTCETTRLNNIADELSPKVLANNLPNSRKGKGGEKDRPLGLLLAVVVLAVILTLICCYCILKKRGMICNKKKEDS